MRTKTARPTPPRYTPPGSIVLQRNGRVAVRGLPPSTAYPCADPLVGTRAAGEDYAGTVLGCATPAQGQRGRALAIGTVVSAGRIRRDLGRRAKRAATPRPNPKGDGVLRHHGEHSKKWRTSAEIAREIRADLKASMASGGLPKMKVSVRSSTYSMGQAVDVEIVQCPFNILNADRVRWERDNPAEYTSMPKLSPRAEQVAGRIRVMAEVYLYSESDLTTDYNNTNCYLRVQYGDDQEERDRAAILAAPRTNPGRRTASARTPRRGPGRASARTPARPNPPRRERVLVGRRPAPWGDLYGTLVTLHGIRVVELHSGYYLSPDLKWEANRRDEGGWVVSSRDGRIDGGDVLRTRREAIEALAEVIAHPWDT